MVVGVALGAGVSLGSGVDVSRGSDVSVGGGKVALGATDVACGVGPGPTGARSAQAVEPSRIARKKMILDRMARLYSHLPRLLQSHNRGNPLYHQAAPEQDHDVFDIPTDQGQVQTPHCAAGP